MTRGLSWPARHVVPRHDPRRSGVGGKSRPTCRCRFASLRDKRFGLEKPLSVSRQSCRCRFESLVSAANRTTYQQVLTSRSGDMPRSPIYTCSMHIYAYNVFSNTANGTLPWSRRRREFPRRQVLLLRDPAWPLFLFSARDSPPPLLEDAVRTSLTTPERQKPVRCLTQYELRRSVGLSIQVEVALLLVLENSSASHYNDACESASVCELLRKASA